MGFKYPMKLRQIQEKDFPLIIKSETDVYPTETPLTIQILTDWYLKEDKFSDFGMIYEDEKNNILGFALFLPYKLNSFQKLCCGALSELESTSEDFISKKSVLQDPYVGIHVYHIHKYKKINNFWQKVFKDLGKIQLKYNLKIFGVSSLAVSYSGINLFGNILNFYENSSFINEQHLMEKNGSLELLEIKDFEKIRELMKNGYRYKTRYLPHIQVEMSSEKKATRFYIFTPKSENISLKAFLEEYEVVFTKKSTNLPNIWIFEQHMPYNIVLNFEFSTQNVKIPFKRCIEKEDCFEIINLNSKLYKNMSPLSSFLEYLIKEWLMEKKFMKISNFIQKINFLIQDSKKWEVQNVNIDVNNAIITTLPDFLCRVSDFRDSISFCTYFGLIQEPFQAKFDLEKLENLIKLMINKNPSQDIDDEFINVKQLRLFEIGMENIIFQENLTPFLKVLLCGCLNFIRLEIKVPLFTFEYEKSFLEAVQYLLKNVSIRNPKVTSYLIKFTPNYKYLEYLLNRIDSKYIGLEDIIQKIHEFDQEGNEIIREEILNLFKIPFLQNEDLLYSLLNTKVVLYSKSSFLSSIVSCFAKSIKKLTKVYDTLQGFKKWIVKNVTTRQEYESFLENLNFIIEQQFLKEHNQILFDYIILSPYFLETPELELLKDLLLILSRNQFSSDLNSFLLNNCIHYVKSLSENQEMYQNIYEIIDSSNVQKDELLKEFFQELDNNQFEGLIKDEVLIDILKISKGVKSKMPKLNEKIKKINNEIENKSIRLVEIRLIKDYKINYILLLEIFQAKIDKETLESLIKEIEYYDETLEKVYYTLTNYCKDSNPQIDKLITQKKIEDEMNLKECFNVLNDIDLYKKLSKKDFDFLYSLKDSIFFKSIWKQNLKQKSNINEVTELSMNQWKFLFEKFDKYSILVEEILNLENDYKILKNRCQEELNFLAENIESENRSKWVKKRAYILYDVSDSIFLKKYSNPLMKVIEFLELPFVTSMNTEIFKNFQSRQLDFIVELSESLQVIKWLTNYPSNEEFERLCEIYTDDLRVIETKEALKKIRDCLKPFLYSKHVFKSFDLFKSELFKLPIEKESLISNLSLLNRNFNLLLKLFEEKTRSQGIEALYELKDIINHGKYSLKSIGIISCSTSKWNKTLNDLEDLRNQIFLINIPNLSVFQDLDVELQKFTKQVSCLSQIRNLIQELYNRGYFEYQEFDFEIKVKGSEIELKDKQNQLKKEIEKWDTLMIEARKKYYFLNLFSSIQILKIFKFLEYDTYNQQDIFNLLKIGNLNLKISNLNWQKNMKIEEKLFGIGKLLNGLYQNTFPEFREINPSFIDKEIENFDYLQRLKIDGFCFISKSSLKEVMESVISIYSFKSRIPQPEEVLFCTEETTEDEIRSILGLWMNAKDYNRSNMIYCITNFEKLSLNVQSLLSKKIQKYLDGDTKRCSSLCLISGSQQHLMTHLSNYQVNFKPMSQRNIIKAFTDISQTYSNEMISFTSENPSQGKTHQIQRSSYGKKAHYERVIINQNTKEESIIKMIHQETKKCLHLDIYQFTPEEFNITLFKMLYIGILNQRESEKIFIRDSSHSFYMEFASNLPWKFNFSLEYLPKELVLCNGQYFDLYNCKFNPNTRMIEIEKNDKIMIVANFLNPEKNVSSKTNMDISKAFYSIKHYIFNDINYSKLQQFVNLFYEMLLIYIKKHTLFTETKNLKVLKYNDMDHTFIDLMTYSCANLVTNQYPDYPIIFFNSEGKTIADIIIQGKIRLNSDIIIRLKTLGIEIHDQIQNEKALDLFKRLTHRKDLDEKLSFFLFNTDNTRKSVTLYLKIKNNIPVILCGNTGNGKREILTYISSLFQGEFKRLSIHRGLSIQIIEKWFNVMIEEAKRKYETKIFVFFDMINSFENVDIFKQYISDRIFQGESIPPNLIVLASCHPQNLINSQNQTIYRLPSTLENSLTDYGKLSNEAEITYIKDTIKNKFPNQFKLRIFELFTDLIFKSQEFKKEKGYENYSLRDVRLCIKVFEFFIKFMSTRENCLIKDILELSLPKISQKCIILSLSYTYYCRIQPSNRRDYILKMNNTWVKTKIIKEFNFEDVFEKEQEYYLKNMIIPENISINESLKENLFMILISTLIKNPIIISGLSGTSKSLAVDILVSNLNGSSSNSEFFRSLPSIEIFRCQCSPLSKFESIQKLFEAAKKFQKNVTQKTTTILLLNEVGLLKNLNPLKIIQKEIEENNHSISLLGLSNSKINSIEFYQAIVLFRPPPLSNDLRNTVSKMITSDQVIPWVYPITKSYSEFYENQETRDFFALRDLYYLIKFINRNAMKPSQDMLLRGIMRNFGGKEKDTNQFIHKVFSSIGLKIPKEYPSTLSLIQENLIDSNARNLMLFTQDYNSGLSSLFNFIFQGQSIPFVIFKSEFKQESSEVYLYSNIQRIKKYMSEGRTIIIVGYNEIYESLFELFNMQYIEYKNQRNVYLSVGTHSKLCPVHKDFRVIILAENSNDFQFPFLNKFEKQILNKQDMLNNDECELEKRIIKWIKHFEEENPFIGFNSDFTSSLAISLTRKYPNMKPDELFEKAIDSLLWICTTDGIVRVGSKYFDIYFKQQRHNDLKSIINFCIQNKNDFFIKGFKLEIVTYTPSYITPNEIINPIKDLFKEITLIQLNSINNEEELIEKIEVFHQKTLDNSLLIIQTDMNSASMLKLIHTKYLCEIINSKYKEKNILFLVHIRPGKQSNSKYTYYFDTIWRGIFVDDLRDLSPNIQELLSIPLPDLLSSRNIKEHFLKNDNFKNALNMLSYSELDINRAKKISNIRNMIENEEIWEKLRQILIYTTTKLFTRESNSHWCEYVATKEYKEIIMSGSFQESILSSIFKMVIKSFAFLLSNIDKNSNLSLLLTSNKSIWLNLLEKLKQEIFYVKFDTFEREIIQVSTDQFKSYQSQYPFSFMIINEIEKNKSHFEKEKEEKLLKYMDVTFPGVNHYQPEKYLNDFINSYGSKCTELDQNQQMKVIKMILNFERKIESILDIHLSFWKQEKRIMIYFNILESIPTIKNEFLSKLENIKSLTESDVYIIDSIYVNCDPNQQNINLSFKKSAFFENINTSRTHIQQLLSLIEDKEIQSKQTKYWNQLLFFVKLCSINSSFEKSLLLWNQIKDQLSSQKSLNLVINHVKYMDIPNTQNIEFLYDDYFNLIDIDLEFYHELYNLILKKYEISIELFNSIFKTLIKNPMFHKDFKSVINSILDQEMSGEINPNMISLFVSIYEKRFYQSVKTIELLSHIQNIQSRALTLERVVIIKTGIRLLISNLSSFLHSENVNLNLNLVNIMQKFFKKYSFLQKVFIKNFIESRGVSLLFALKNQLIEYFPWIENEFKMMKDIKMFSINRFAMDMKSDSALTRDFQKIFYHTYLKYTKGDQNYKDNLQIIEEKHPIQYPIFKGFITNSFYNDGDYFKLNSDTSPSKILLVSLIGNIISNTLSSKLPFLYNLLIQPKRLVSLYLPSMNSKDNNFEFNIKLYKCNNDHIVSVDFCSNKSIYKCPKCNSSLSQIQNEFLNDVDNMRGYCVLDHCNDFAFKKERKMSPLSFRMIRFIIHSILFVASASSESYLEDFSRISLNQHDYSPITFYKKMVQDWIYLCEITGKTPEDVALFLLIILESIPKDHILSSIELKNEGKREEWEIEFSNFVEEKLKFFNLNFEQINQDLFKKSEYEYIYSLPKSYLPFDSDSSLIWKYEPIFNYQDFIRMYYSSEKRNNYPLINMFIQDYEIIKATGNLNIILNWVKLVSSNLNGKIDRIYSKIHNIRDFIDSFPLNERESLRKMFGVYQETFNFILPHLNYYGCEKLPKNMRNFKLTEDSPLSFSIPDDRDEFIYPLSFIRFLVDKHNEIIEKSQEYHPNPTIKKFVSSQNLSETHLFNMNIQYNLLPFIEGNIQIKEKLTDQESKCIDEFIYYECFYGKLRIKLELQTFTFLNEQKSDGEIASKVESKIPQVEIDNEKKIEIERKLKQQQNSKIYLNQIETCCVFISSTLLIYPKASEIKIVEFLKEYLSIKVEDSIYQDLTLEHIISLWRLLESNSYSFEDLDRKFKSIIPKDLKTNLINSMPNLSKQILIQQMNKFMSGYLINSEQNPEVSLKEVLGELSSNDTELKEMKWFKYFPNDLNLSHFYEVLQLLEEFKDQDQKIDGEGVYHSN